MIQLSSLQNARLFCLTQKHIGMPHLVMSSPQEEHHLSSTPYKLQSICKHTHISWHQYKYMHAFQLSIQHGVIESPIMMEATVIYLHNNLQFDFQSNVFTGGKEVEALSVPGTAWWS